MINHSEAGKGDRPRPCDQELYARNYVKIFGARCPVCKGNEEYRKSCKCCEGKGKVFDIDKLKENK